MLSRIFETVKTVMIFVLCVTMLVMMLLLMIADPGNDDVAYPFEERMIFYGDGAEATDWTGMDVSRLRPTAIALRSPSQMEEDGALAENATLRVVFDGDVLPNVYTSLYPLLQDLLGSSAVSTVPNNGDVLWKEALRSENLLYMVYADDLPTALIFAYTFDDGETEESQALPTHSAYGKELLFTEDEQTKEVCLLVRAADGTVTRFTPNEGASYAKAASNYDDMPISDEAISSDDNLNGSTGEALPTDSTPTVASANEKVSLHASALSAYIEIVGNLVKEAHLACFLCELPENEKKPTPVESISDTGEDEQMYANAPLDDTVEADSEASVGGAYYFGRTAIGTDTALIYQGARALPIVTLSSFVGMQALDENEEAGLYTLLHAVGMRDSAVENHYIDRDGGRVYLDGEGRLYISADGTVSYTALQNGSISGSAFLGYSNVSGVYSLKESLQISDRLVTDFSKRIVPMLCGVEQNDEGTVSSNVLQMPILSVTAVTLEEDVSGVRIRYGYSIDGVALCDETGKAITSFSVVISGDAVISLSVLPIVGVQEEQMGYLLPMQVALEAMTYENAPDADKYGVLKAAYVVEGALSNPKTLSPEWLFLED